MIDLFEPYEPLSLKNRSVMAPMTRYSCLDDGSPTKELKEYYLTRAKNDLGLIIVESCAVNNTHAKAYKNGAEFHSKAHVEQWKDTVQKIKELDTKVWLQIFHAGRLTVEEIAGVEPVAPSAIKCFDGKSYWRPSKDGEVLHFQTQTAFQTPKSLETKEIEEIISQFANACTLAEEAGFDGVEIHGAHGYLIHQFCHAETNKRTDKYNAKDFLFISELVKACRKAVSAKFILSYRLSLHMVDSNYIRFSDKDLDYKKLIEILIESGIDVFHSSELNAGGKMFGSDDSLHSIIKKHTDKPIIVCGRINKLSKANDLLNKDASLIAFGRSLISNPNLLSHLKNEKESDLIKFDYEKHMATLV